MEKLNTLADKEFIFGSLLMVANKLDTLLERELQPFGVTAKQWFLSAIVDTLFEKPPTIKEVAKTMGTSHQNIKQVAMKLEQKGLLSMTKDPRDARVTRLKLTRESQDFWHRTSQKGIEFNAFIFNGLNEDELSVLRKGLFKLWSNLLEMENDLDGKGELE